MKRLALALVALLLASCGGGGGSSSVAPANTQAKTQAGSVVLAIPTRAPTSGKIRYPQFVSPNAISVGISVNGAAAQFFDVSATSALCVTSGTGVRTCTLPFSAPFGSDTFTITIYLGANGTGAVLATATSTNTVVAGTPFSFTVAMNAIIGTIIANIPSTPSASCPNAKAFPGNLGITEGCTANGTLTVIVDDPSGAQVTGSAPYASPIQVSTNDPSVTPAPVQITAPGQTSVLTYSGVALTAAITNSLTVSLTVGAQAVPLAIPVQRQYLYVTNGAPPPTIPAGPAGNVAVYTFGSGAGALPARVIAGANTQLIDPVFPLLDAAGNLYVLDNGMSLSGFYAPTVLVFAPGATGNATPIRQITGLAAVTFNQSCLNVIFDPTGQYLFVLCNSSTIHVFPVGANGTAAATEVAQLGSDSFNQAFAEAFDPSGNLYVADVRQNAIDGFPAPIPPTVTNFSLAPNVFLFGGSWPNNPNVAPVGVGFDKAGNLYASIVNTGAAGAEDANNEIGIWQPSTLISCDGCVQNAYLLGGALANHAPALFTLDGTGNLYVGNPVTNQVFVFAAATVTSAGNPTNNPAVLHTINTAAAPNGPVGLAIGP